MNCRQTMNNRYASPASECAPCSTRNSCGNGEPLDTFPVAMAYVPWQTFHHTLDLQKALMVGTIFPELCQSFCGRGPRR